MDQQQNDIEVDMSEYELDDTAELTVQNVKRDDDMLYKGQPVKVRVYSPGSPQAVKVLHKSSQLATLRMQALLRGKVDKKAAEQADEERVNKLVGITHSFVNFPADPRKVYGNPKMIDFADQVEAFFNDKANFSKGSTAS